MDEDCFHLELRRIDYYLWTLELRGSRRSLSALYFHRRHRHRIARTSNHLLLIVVCLVKLLGTAWDSLCHGILIVSCVV
jgi:hypothetical protein